MSEKSFHNQKRAENFLKFRKIYVECLRFNDKYFKDRKNHPNSQNRKSAIIVKRVKFKRLTVDIKSRNKKFKVYAMAKKMKNKKNI